MNATCGCDYVLVLHLQSYPVCLHCFLQNLLPTDDTMQARTTWTLNPSQSQVKYATA
jgi:hypothetical protein